MQASRANVDSLNLDGWFTQTISVSALIAAVTGWVPFALAAIPIVYYLIMIWETRTVVHWRNNWKQKRIAKQYAKLKAREKVTLAQLEAIELLRTARVEAREKVAHAAHEADVMLTKTASNPPPEIMP